MGGDRDRGGQSGWGRDATEVVVVVLAALVVRLVYLMAARTDPFFFDLVMDEKVHWDWATAILRDGGMEGPFYRAPLYYYLLAAVRGVVGDSVLLARAVSAVPGAVTCGLLYLGVRRFGGRLPAVVVTAGYGVAIDLVHFDTRLLTDQLAATLMFAAVLVASGRSPQPWAFGLLAGLAEQTRPVAVILFPVWLLGEILRLAGGDRWQRRLAQRAAVALLAFVLPVLPATVHNFRESGDVIPVAWNGGINFYIGNNASSDGMSAVEKSFRKDWWGSYHDFIAAAERAEGRELSPGEVSDHWYRQGRGWIVDNPGDFVRHLVHKARLFASGVEISNNLPITPEIAMAGPPWSAWPLTSRWLMPFLVPAVLLLVGRSVPMVARLSAAAALSYAALIVLVFVTSRYRLPVLPPLAVVAGGCLALALDRQRPWSRIVPLGLALVAAVPVARAEMPTNWPAWWTAVGNQHITSGRAGEAEMAFRRAEQLVPGFPQVQEGLGMAAEAQGRTVEAMQHYRREMQSHDSPFSRYRLAALLHEAGQSAEAAELLEPVVGRFDDASLLYGQSLVAAGELERARDHLVRRRQAGEFDGDHRYLLALVQVMRGDPAAAEAFEGMPDEERWRRLRQLFVARSSSAETADGRSE